MAARADPVASLTLAGRIDELTGAENEREPAELDLGRCWTERLEVLQAQMTDPHALQRLHRWELARRPHSLTLDRHAQSPVARQRAAACK